MSISVSGCGDDTSSGNEMDLSGHYFDIGLPPYHDMATNDLAHD